MNSVILATDQAITFQELFLKLQAQWPKVYATSPERMVVEDGEDHVYVNVYADLQEEYAPEELGRILQLMPSPCFFVIDYSNGKFVRRVLLGIADDPRIVVDNNAGTILPGPEFARRLRNEPAWDWFEEFRRNHPRDGGG